VLAQAVPSLVFQQYNMLSWSLLSRCVYEGEVVEVEEEEEDKNNNKKKMRAKGGNGFEICDDEEVEEEDGVVDGVVDGEEVLSHAGGLMRMSRVGG
jgi:hypothetical protein